MSTPTHDDTAELSEDIRAAGLALTDGAVVFYDPENPHAWVESDSPVDLDERR